MGVRDSLLQAARDVARSAGLDRQISDGLTRVAKVFGPGVPESFQRGEEASQMTPASPFSPGTPIGPYDGYDRTPRSRDFVTGYNIATRPRTHERVSFEALRGLIEAYDIAQLAIAHRIDSIRALDWKLVAADDQTGDVADAIKLGMKALERPDREHYFDNWFAMWAWDVLAYDAGCLYRLRNRAGRAVGLRVVSGPTIAPLIDYWGNSPAAEKPGDPEPEAYVQYANGLPWNWLTRSDLIYEPFRLRSDSPYGHAPLESIILNANTDIRFQIYFLERFTSGNLPAAFAAAPESWGPEQIEQFQAYWDAMMFGNQAEKHQIKWMPPGSKFEWSNEKDFSDVFSLFLMRKSLAAYHVVPADMGFTENVNRSSGESQADVQHRLGDAPFARHASRIITGFLQNDLGLPIRHMFDLGEEQDDRVAQAQADQIYVNMGSIGASEIREMRYGRPEPEGRPVPRYIFSSRQGPIPLASLFAVAGHIDPETGAPVPGSKLPEIAFGGAEGVLPNPPLRLPSLAEQEFGRAAIPPAPPPQPVEGEPVAKEDGGAVTTGITSETGIYGDPLIRGEEDEDPDPDVVAKRFMTVDEARQIGREVREREMAVFRRFYRARRKDGQWRDFEFEYHSPSEARELNRSGMVAIAKAAGEIAVAGLAVLAADTGRVLMLQRALCDDDPAAGKIEFPGGHIEDGESPLQAAWREWSEETGSVPPPGVQTGTWTAGDGIYQGIVWTAESEASVPVRGETVVPNPDDPDGDLTEAIIWMDPADLPGNPVVRSELLASVDDVLAALGCTPDPDCCGAECCTDGCCDGGGGCTCGTAGVAKAVVTGPKARSWPGWKYDLQTAEHWAPKVTAAVLAVLPADRLQQIARDYFADHPPQDAEDTGKRELNDQAAAWLREHAPDLAAAIAVLVAGVLADAYLIGAVSAAAVTSDSRADTGGWEPGDTAAAENRISDLGLGGDYQDTAGSQSGDRAGWIAGGILAALGRTLAAGLLNGSGPDDLALAADLAETAGDTSLVSGLLTTVITGISSLAAKAWYQLTGIQQVSWATAEDARVCVACMANEDASPVLLGTPFPSGDLWPPGHNRCRCALVGG